MEITLEKIELVKDRTGVSYKEAKDALEAADGSVVDAIISIEATINEQSEGKGIEGTAIADKIKEIIRKGNVSRIVVRRGGETFLNLPVSAGIVGTIIAPWGAVAAVIASFGFKCNVEIVKVDGTVVDVSDTVRDKASLAREKGEVAYNAAKEKGEEAYNAAKEKAEETVAKMREMNVERKGKAFDDIDFSSCFEDESGFGIEDEVESAEDEKNK